MATNYNSWLAKFKKGQQLVLDASSKAINASLMMVYKKTIERTPVGNPMLWHPPYWPADYTPGQLKASWGISFSNTQRDTKGKFVSAEQLTGSGGISLKVNRASKNYATIYNTQPYAQRVEYEGWSTQAPAGMLRVSLSEYPSLLGSNAQKYRIK